MKTVGAALFVLLGLAIAGFAANVAVNGAEPALPAASACVEGEVLAGTTVVSPVGEPFLYAEVRIQDADNTQANIGTIHWRGAFGSPDVVVRTARGDVRVHLPPPGRWRVLEGMEESREVASLERLPIVGRVNPGDRLSAPFRIAVRAIRPGTHVIATRDPGARVPLYVGERAAHDNLRAQHEGARWPIVLLLSVMAGVSLYIAHRIRSGSVFGATSFPDEEGGAS